MMDQPTPCFGQTRRTFLKNAGLVVVTGTLSLGLAACDSGGMDDGGEFKAFTSTCTHQGYDVNSYNIGAQRFSCPCHGSQFNLEGTAVNGPATRPLATYAVTRNGDMLSVQIG